MCVRAAVLHSLQASAHVPKQPKEGLQQCEPKDSEMKNDF